MHKSTDRETDAAFGARAADWIREAICDLRRHLRFNPDDGQRAASLVTLESFAGPHAPTRASLCGDCQGCGLMAGTPPHTIH